MRPSYCQLQGVGRGQSSWDVLLQQIKHVTSQRLWHSQCTEWPSAPAHSKIESAVAHGAKRKDNERSHTEQGIHRLFTCYLGQALAQICARLSLTLAIASQTENAWYAVTDRCKSLPVSLLHLQDAPAGSMPALPAAGAGKPGSYVPPSVRNRGAGNSGLHRLSGCPVHPMDNRCCVASLMYMSCVLCKGACSTGRGQCLPSPSADLVFVVCTMGCRRADGR